MYTSVKKKKKKNSYFYLVPGSLAGKESPCNAGDPSSIPGLGRSPGEGTGYPLQCSWASLVTQMVKNLSAIWETWVRSPGWEDPLKEDMATHSSILAWRISMDRGAWWATVHGLQTVKQDWVIKHCNFILRALFYNLRLPWWLSRKESIFNVGDVGLIPGSGRSPREEMATHSSIFAWEIPWTGEPGRLHTVHGVTKESKTT